MVLIELIDQQINEKSILNPKSFFNTFLYNILAVLGHKKLDSGILYHFRLYYVIKFNSIHIGHN